MNTPVSLATSERRSRMTFGTVAAIYAAFLFLVLANAFGSYFTDTSPNAEPPWQFFYYFTNQSNLLVLALLVVFAVANLGNGPLAAAAGRLMTQGVILGVTLYMMVVFVIVAVILNPFYTGAYTSVEYGKDLWVHVVSPALMVALLLLYPWKGQASWRTVLAWMGYLIFYVGLANVIGTLVTKPDGSRDYPYDFLNPASYGGNFGVYLLVIAGLAVACFLVGMGLLRLKQRFDAGYR